MRRAIIIAVPALGATFSSIVVVATLVAVVVSGSAGVTGVAHAQTVNKCQAGKSKCVVKKATCLLGCHAKAEATGALDAGCLLKCTQKFDGNELSPADPTKGCVQKLQLKGGCLTADETATMEATIDAFVDDIAMNLASPGLDNKCQAGKKKCVSKHTKCLLGCYAKAEATGVLDAGCLLKCARKFDGNELSPADPTKGCIQKLQAKGDCFTVDETTAMETKVDAFADAVMCALDPSLPGVCPFCGDDVANTLDEECDGVDAAACSGQCGAPTSLFPCLCLTNPRARIVEHGGADHDRGWTGFGHDGSGAGASYLVDLYDCGGLDTLCTVGPSCAGGAHAACVQDSDCGLDGPCRKRRTAVGPHCHLDVQQVCSDNSDCPGTGDFCVKSFHGPPQPFSGGGIGWCVVNVFSEDIVGTADVLTGSSSVRLRQRSSTYLGPLEAPCPVCEGIPTPVCSAGPNVGKACRPDPPFGGDLGMFGTTSIDCPPNGSPIAFEADHLLDPLTTGAITKTSTYPCSNPAFAADTCVGGPDEGATCTMDGDCSGGTCNPQCFCPGELAPNACDSACVGGTEDAAPCSDDLDCTGGFCHRGDCRTDPGDPSGANEGSCTAGPLDGACSTHTFRSCSSDVDCQGFACPFCDPGETCVMAPRQCFVNSGIVRSGTAHATAPTRVATWCEPGTSSATFNSFFVGLPGPAAIRYPSTVTVTGVP